MHEITLSLSLTHNLKHEITLSLSLYIFIQLHHLCHLSLHKCFYNLSIPSAITPCCQILSTCSFLLQAFYLFVLLSPTLFIFLFSAFLSLFVPTFSLKPYYYNRCAGLNHHCPRSNSSSSLIPTH